MSLLCPVCGEALLPGEKTAQCPRGHAFDRARAGYWNLLLDQASHGHGDDKPMLRARRDFLALGHYRPIARAVAQAAAKALPAGGSLTDAGCGEGYYTRLVLDHLDGRQNGAFAFDVSKEAARMTASLLGPRCTVFVASAYHIPLASESQDLVLSLFSPYAREEYARILKPGGTLIRAVPLPDHLWELKAALYDAPRPGGEGKEEPDDLFALTGTVDVREKFCLKENRAVQDLFAMTPYAHKTSPADRQKLEAIPELNVTLACRILISAKKAC